MERERECAFGCFDCVISCFGSKLMISCVRFRACSLQARRSCVGWSRTACRVSAMLAQIPARLLQPMHIFCTPRHRGCTCTHPASWNLQLIMRRRPTSGTSSMRGPFAAAKAPIVSGAWELWSACSCGNENNEKSGRLLGQTQCTQGHSAAEPSPSGPRLLRLHWSILLMKMTTDFHLQWSIHRLKVISGSHAAVHYDYLKDFLQTRHSSEIVERIAELAYEACSCHRSLREMYRDMADFSEWHSTGFMKAGQFQLRGARNRPFACSARVCPNRILSWSLKVTKHSQLEQIDL